MTTLQPAHTIAERFASEQAYIQRYVEFLQAAAEIWERDVSEILNVLKRQGFNVSHSRRERERYGDPYSAEELAAVVTELKRLQPELGNVLATTEHALEATPEPAGLATIDARSDVGEWIETAVGWLGEHGEPGGLEIARQHISTQEQEASKELGEEFEPLDSSQIDFILSSAVYIHRRRKRNELHFVRLRIDELDLAARVLRGDSELNVLRQTFILLVTAFDAAIFDIVRIALRRSFFQLIGAFGKQEKVSLQEMANYDQFENLRDAIIEQQLKSRYLKDLIELLRGLGVECVDKNAGQKPVDLAELVLRRNIHVHNRGIVDDRYLERDTDGTPRFNIYNLAVGTVAEIDEAYWIRANVLTTACVQRVAAWADSISPTK